MPFYSVLGHIAALREAFCRAKRAHLPHNNACGTFTRSVIVGLGRIPFFWSMDHRSSLAIPLFDGYIFRHPPNYSGGRKNVQKMNILAARRTVVIMLIFVSVPPELNSVRPLQDDRWHRRPRGLKRQCAPAMFFKPSSIRQFIDIVEELSEFLEPFFAKVFVSVRIMVKLAAVVTNCGEGLLYVGQ